MALTTWLSLEGQPFWRDAWRVADVLALPPGSLDGQEEALGALAGDFLLQGYIFQRVSFSDDQWLPALEASGLFENPPAPEASSEGLRARQWPAMAYLRAVAQRRPKDAARILRRLQTNNWWVIADALEVGALLPVTQALPVLRRLITEWERAPIRWTSPETLASVIAKIGSSRSSAAFPTEAVLRIVRGLIQSPGRGYDLDELLAQARETIRPIERSRLADGIELAIISQLSMGERLPHLGLYLDLDRVVADSRKDLDPILVAIASWLELVAKERQRRESGRLAIRTLRLRIGQPLAHAMSLRALRLALDGVRTDPLATELLRQIVSDHQVIEDWRLEGEVTPLLERHFDVLSDESKEAFISRVSDAAQSAESADVHRAHRLLHAIRSSLGAKERLLLRNLDQALGMPTGQAPEVAVYWSGPESPLKSERASELPASALLSWMRHVPKGEGDRSDSALEGMARVVQGEVTRRPGELASILPAIAESVPYPSIVHGVIRGYEEALKSENVRGALDANAVLAFLDTVTRQAIAGTYEPNRYFGSPQSGLVGASADLIEEFPAFVLEGDHVLLLRLIRSALDDPDPDAERETARTDDSLDLPMLALNSTRGKGLRALLALIFECWRRDEDELSGQLSEVMLNVATGERSPAVRSVFGLYLPWLIKRWPSASSSATDSLLPVELERGGDWEAVFVTYLMFRPAFHDVAEPLRRHYELAVSRLGEEGFDFLRAHASNLALHLSGLHLSPRADIPWADDLFVRALRLADDGEAATALRALAHASLREEIAIEPDWAVSVVERRLESVDGLRPKEVGALLEFLLYAKPAIDRAHTHVIELVQRGADIGYEDVARYLETNDAHRSALGAEILRSLAATGVLAGPWFTHSDDLRDLIAQYAREDPQEMWRTVNHLGRQGHFFVEPEARLIEEQLGLGTQAD